MTPGSTYRLAGVLGPAGTTAADLAGAIAAGTVDRVILDSDGGSIRTGAALADLIDQHQLPIEIHRSVSAAAIVATAGPDRCIAADGFIGVHPSWRAIAGGAVELAAAAGQLRQADEVLAETLARRTRLDIDDAAVAIRTGRRWTADEALTDGLVDRVGPPAGLAGPIPDRIVDGPLREHTELREAADQHHHRALLERSVETTTTMQLDATRSATSVALEAFSPARALAQAFDYAALDAQARHFDPAHCDAPAHWLCDACGETNCSPPSIAYRPTPCGRCGHSPKTTRGNDDE